MSRLHRPWPVPARPWLMVQTWNDLLFAHWPMEVKDLQPLLPRSLTLDTFEGRAWIGIVPFQIDNARIRGMPPVPGFSSTPELNVRTYVVRDQKPGVWFFSLDAANMMAVLGGRFLYHLPYYRASMHVSKTALEVDYRSHRCTRASGRADFEATYGPLSDPFEAEPGSLDDWLTSRYCLYSVDSKGHSYRCEIDHAPWRLQKAQASIRKNAMTEALSISLPSIAPLLHFSKSLQAYIWSLEKIE